MVLTILIILGLVADLVIALTFPSLLRQRQRQQFGSPYGGYRSPYGGGGTYRPYGGGKPLPRPNDPFAHSGQ